jgi:hypothetical protein
MPSPLPQTLIASLAAAGAKDLEEFTERGSLQPRYRPLPRLVIVIDAPGRRCLPHYPDTTAHR